MAMLKGPGTRPSVEVRLTTEGPCECGIPHTIGYQSRCNHRLVCDFGDIEYPNPRPDRGEVGPLMITTHDFFIRLFKDGPKIHHGAVYSVDAVPEDETPTPETILRLYAYIDYQGRRWSWELFEAHWWDGKGPEVYVGRWPD